MTDVKIGDSIAVNGTCLTVIEYGMDHFTADVMPETMDKTNLSDLRPGDPVNLERALRVGDRLGGHLVLGHVDGVGQIIEQKRKEIALITRVKCPAGLIRYVVPKGSVAIDGISLTVVDVDERSFTVSLIPHTAKMTTLGWKKPGDRVNIETDIVGKYVERLLTGPRQEEQESEVKRGIDLDFLREHGFST